MSKYKIIADYDIYDISSQKQDGTITIKIPFKNENGSLQYGVEKILSDLERKIKFIPLKMASTFLHLRNWFTLLILVFPELNTLRTVGHERLLWSCLFLILKNQAKI